MFEATGRHPFWTENEGWIQADHLQAGDRLLDANRNVVNVTEYAQDSISPNFSKSEDVPERWRGRPVSEAVAEARRLGRLPDGLRLDVMKVNDGLVALNSRTLYVAREAGLKNVKVNDMGYRGQNRLTRMQDVPGQLFDEVTVNCK